MVNRTRVHHPSHVTDLSPEEAEILRRSIAMLPPQALSGLSRERARSRSSVSSCGLCASCGEGVSSAHLWRHRSVAAALPVIPDEDEVRKESTRGQMVCKNLDSPEKTRFFEGAAKASWSL